LQKSQRSNVIVTGGAGFIGSHIVERFIRDGFDVYIVDDLSTGSRDSVSTAAHLCEFSITDDAELLRLFRDVQPTVVSHHAAQASVVGSLDDAESDLKTNGSGLLNVLRSSAEVSVRQFIFPSSCAVFGDVSDAVDEMHPLTPLSPYGISKLAGEHYVRYFAEHFGFSASILRYGNVYGPGQSPHRPCGVASIFADRILNGQPIQLFGDGESVRDYIFITDVIDAHMLAIQHQSDKVSVFNVGSGKGTRLIDLARSIRAESGCTASEAKLFSFVPERRGEARACVLRNSFAIETLGWQPHVDLKEGLRRVLGWLRESDCHCH
jgi:UDP-glucose 4-epimerase|tara:strand:- start:41879 stop:42844 length:966 start_codon:yes stop_codon:yes gene_type:complete